MHEAAVYLAKGHPYLLRSADKPLHCNLVSCDHRLNTTQHLHLNSPPQIRRACAGCVHCAIHATAPMAPCTHVEILQSSPHQLVYVQSKPQQFMKTAPRGAMMRCSKAMDS